MAVDLGTDISCVFDIDSLGSTISGPHNLASAIARRLLTPPGGLYYDSDYGLGIHQWLNMSWPQGTTTNLDARVKRECEKDERVQRADAVVTFNQAQSSIVVTVRLLTAAGPYTFVMNVAQAAATTWWITS